MARLAPCSRLPLPQDSSTINPDLVRFFSSQVTRSRRSASCRFQSSGAAQERGKDLSSPAAIPWVFVLDRVGFLYD